MPWSLDVRTVVLVIVLMSVMQSVLMFYVRYLYRNLLFVKEWAYGYFMIALGMMVLVSAGTSPPAWILLISTFFRSWGQVCVCHGIGMLCGTQLPSSVLPKTLLMLVLSHLFVLCLGPTVANVATLMAVCVTVSGSYSIYCCWNAPRNEFRQSLLILAFMSLIYMVCMYMRLVGIYTAHVQEVFGVSNWVGLVLVGTLVFMVSHCTTLILVTSHRFQLELEKQLVLDPLTNVFNRRGLAGHVDRDWARVCRHDSPMSILMIDADYFKNVNDVHGHAAGDAVLVALAQQIQGSLRQEDVLARYGGEEFVVMLPDTRLIDAYEVAERIRRDVADMEFAALKGKHQITVSIGVSERQYKQQNWNQLLERADQALFVAKQSGRNRVCCGEPAIMPNDVALAVS